ncbi:MAG: DUF6285 domain-containing protein, partial [Myxococcota bacterium]
DQQRGTEMNDRPEATELLQAVENFLRQELLPSLEGHLGYQVRVAANVVGMVAREIDSEEAELDAEWTGLMDLLGEASEKPARRTDLRAAIVDANRVLVERIRAGEVDSGPLRGEVLTHLRSAVQAKLRVALGDRA